MKIIDHACGRQQVNQIQQWTEVKAKFAQPSTYKILNKNYLGKKQLSFLSLEITLGFRNQFLSQNF